MLAVKMNYYFEVEAILRKCKYHVYDIDEVEIFFLIIKFFKLKMTPLHWTMKKGLTRMAKLLLDYGADPNAQDIVKRICLFLIFIVWENSFDFGSSCLSYSLCQIVDQFWS